MRREGEIQQKLKQVIYRHRQKLLQENFKKAPQTCIHNGVDLDVRLHLCRHPSQTMRVYCDPMALSCVELAKECQLWQPKSTKEEIKAKFGELMGQKTSTIAAEYPDIAALKWTLQETGGEEIRLDDEDKEMLTLSRWQRFKAWLRNE
jgi:hypothetical protein